MYDFIQLHSKSEIDPHYVFVLVETADGRECLVQVNLEDLPCEDSCQRWYETATDAQIEEAIDVDWDGLDIDADDLVSMAAVLPIAKNCPAA